MEPQEPTLEDFSRTQNRILDAYEAGHGITLGGAEVERLVVMMQGMERVARDTTAKVSLTERLFGMVLGQMEADGSDLEYPAELFENTTVSGFSAQWDEEENVIRFGVFHDPVEVVEGEVEVGEPA